MTLTGLQRWIVWACLALAAGAALPAHAQSSYVDDRYPHLFAPRDQRPRIITIPQGQRPATPRTVRPTETLRPPRDQASAPSATPAADPAAPAPAAPSGPTTFVLVMGDNLAEWLAYGLEEAFEDVPELGVVDKTRLSSGLTRPEFHDWVRAVPETLAGQEKVDFIVMMLGSNDRQSIRVERESVDPDNERWRGLYAERVDQVMQAMKARGVPVYWVGVPPLRGQRTSAHMQLLNAIYKERAERNGVSFVDVWNGFIDEHGAYTQFGGPPPAHRRRRPLHRRRRPQARPLPRAGPAPRPPRADHPGPALGRHRSGRTAAGDPPRRARARRTPPGRGPRADAPRHADLACGRGTGPDRGRTRPARRGGRRATAGRHRRFGPGARRGAAARRGSHR